MSTAGRGGLADLPGKFSRVEEHLFVVTIGGVDASPWMRNMLKPIKKDKGATTGPEWLGLRRRRYPHVFEETLII